MAPSSAKQRLIDWANAQDGWVRAVVSDVLAGGPPQLERTFASLLVEKELAPGTPTSVAPLVASKSDDDVFEALRLERLRGVSGVNALAAGQEIVFHPRLTVLYGENAAGKSGYARILKRLAGVRSAETVLGNFRDSAAAPAPSPRAVVEYSLAGEQRTLEWSDEAGVAPFTRMSVFDTRAVTLHVDEDLTYVFTPEDVAVYGRVHEAIGALKAKLDAQAADARPKAAGNPFLPAFKRDATVFPLIEALGAATDLDALKALAANHAERLEALRDQAESLRPESSKGRQQAALSDSELYGSLLSIASALHSFDAAAYAAAAERVKTADTAREAAVDDAFADDQIAGSNLPSWRAFIEAAEKFLDDVGEKTYPSRGDDCVYCRQPLKPPAVTLVKRYRRHIKDSSQRDFETASADLAARKTAIASLPIVQVLTLVSRRVEALDQVPALLTRTVALLELAMKLQQTGTVDFAELHRVAAEIEAGAGAAKKSADDVIASQKKQASDRQRELDKVSEELRTLENRLALQTHLKQIEAFVATAKWASAAVAVSGRISSVMRSLTEQSKLANEEALNQDFAALFLAECERLKAPAVDFSGRKGQAARRKVFSEAEHRLSEILSEGEQKVIALADFLAEATLRPAPAPIVFDDPVTSLDHRRMDYVADRLVQLSETRQVVVFTHNVWFATGLMKRLPTGTLYGISAANGQTGVVGAADLVTKQ